MKLLHFLKHISEYFLMLSVRQHTIKTFTHLFSVAERLQSMLHYGRLHPATILSTFPASHILSSFRGGPPSPPPLTGPGVAQQQQQGPPHHSVFGAMQVCLWGVRCNVTSSTKMWLTKNDTIDNELSFLIKFTDNKTILRFP